MEYVEIYRIAVRTSNGFLNDQMPQFIIMIVFYLLLLIPINQEYLVNRHPNLFKKLFWSTGIRNKRFMILVAVILVASSVYSHYSQVNKEIDLITILEEKKFSTVEGEINNFSNTYTNKHIESFSISGVEFEYHQRNGKAGYNIPMKEGGLLKPDLRVRIGYYVDEILRIFEIDN